MPVCHRFQDLILRIVHSRLLLAASLKDVKLILECYHPSAQYTEPYLFCDYLGTPGLSDEVEGQGSIYKAADKDGRLGRLRGIYSRFRPTRPDADPPFRSRFSGDTSESRTYSADFVREPSDPVEMVSQTINLDAHELFSQICVSANLVKVGPRRGVFLSCIDVLRKTTPRIWRHWLAQQSSGATKADQCEDERVIWVDKSRNVGIRARVEERRWRRNLPVLMHKDEDQAVSYSLELEGNSITGHEPFYL